MLITNSLRSIRFCAWFGLGLASASCSPRIAQEFRPTLTPTQQSALQTGSPLEFTHTTYYPFRKQRVYSTGQMRVDQQADGKLRYQRVGQWKQFYANGEVFVAIDYDTGKSSDYTPDGTLNHDTYNFKDAYPGDSVQVTRNVRFVNGNRQDTLYVQHMYYQNDQYVKELFTKDFQGKRVIQR
jgi:hypothetical protein